MGMSWVDYLIVGIYFCFVLGIGWVAVRLRDELVASVASKQQRIAFG